MPARKLLRPACALRLVAAAAGIVGVVARAATEGRRLGVVSGVGVPVVGAIAAGRPIEARHESFQSENSYDTPGETPYPSLAVDARMFAGSGDLVAMQIEGDSMIDAGILDGDYVVVRRQKTVENGEIAAVFIEGEGTLKRLFYNNPIDGPEGDFSGQENSAFVRLEAANDRFDPLVITEDNQKEVTVFGKYVGLVRGDLRVL